jgi:hypothetical protein
MIDGWTRCRQRNLRYLLNEWDPIGLAEIAPDEYGCLIGPLCAPTEWSGRPEISTFLRYELEDHFGLDPERCDVGASADRLVAWWATTATEDAQ